MDDFRRLLALTSSAGMQVTLADLACLETGQYLRLPLLRAKPPPANGKAGFHGATLHGALGIANGGEIRVSMQTWIKHTGR